MECGASVQLDGSADSLREVRCCSTMSGHHNFIAFCWFYVARLSGFYAVHQMNMQPEKKKNGEDVPQIAGIFQQLREIKQPR